MERNSQGNEYAKSRNYLKSEKELITMQIGWVNVKSFEN